MIYENKHPRQKLLRCCFMNSVRDVGMGNKGMINAINRVPDGRQSVKMPPSTYAGLWCDDSVNSIGSHDAT